MDVAGESLLAAMRRAAASAAVAGAGCFVTAILQILLLKLLMGY